MADTHIKINAVTPRVQYTGNGVTTTFPYEFAIFDETDMVVYVGDDIIESGYTVTGAGETEGGTVVFDTAPDDGAKITLLRNVPIERVTDFQEGGTFRPKNLNDEFDRQTAFVQQVQEELSRCVKVDPTSSTNPEEILPKVEELYDHIDNIDAVADDLSNIDTVATNISDVGTCVTNMEDIQAAPGAATTASNAAIAAAASATAAAISAAGTHFKLFQHDWFDYELDDMAWLRADTFSWQDGTVYTTAYKHLIDDMDGKTATTETVAGITIAYYLADDGHKICTEDQLSNVESIYNNTGVAWYYILGTTTNPGKFKLPRTKYGFTGYRDTVGKYVAAGLPNITGSWNSAQYTGDWDSDGCVYGVSNSSSEYNGGSSGMRAYIDASRSSSIYGNSTTVQPPATQMYLYFYVGEYAQPAIEQTAGLNASLFNGKVDLDLSNMNPSAASKATIDTWGTPDYTAGISVPFTTSWTTTGQTYTAPSNGVFYISNLSAINPDALELYVNDVLVCKTGKGSTVADWRMMSCRVKNGDVIKVAAETSYTSSNIVARFFPLIGG